VRAVASLTGFIGSARVVAFGVSGVAPAGSVVGGLVILVSYAGFASPLVVIIAFVASLCCANSIAEFARRLPSAGSLYTYNSRGLGRIGGFLTGWMMIAAYALYLPAGIALTSAFASLLLAAVAHVTISPWVLFLVCSPSRRPPRSPRASSRTHPRQEARA
jgi:amino acid transporter